MGYLLLFGCLVTLLGSHGMQGKGQHVLRSSCRLLGVNVSFRRHPCAQFVVDKLGAEWRAYRAGC